MAVYRFCPVSPFVGIGKKEGGCCWFQRLVTVKAPPIFPGGLDSSARMGW